MVANEASPDANVIWGVAFDDSLDDEIRITIIATGFDKKPEDVGYVSPVQQTVVTPVAAPVVTPVAAPVVEAKPVVEPVVVAAPVVEEAPAVEEPAAAPVVETPVVEEPKKKVDVDGTLDLDNLWDVFRRK